MMGLFGNLISNPFIKFLVHSVDRRSIASRGIGESVCWAGLVGQAGQKLKPIQSDQSSFEEESSTKAELLDRVVAFFWATAAEPTPPPSLRPLNVT